MKDRSPQKTGQTPDPKSKRVEQLYAMRRYDTLHPDHPQNRLARMQEALLHPPVAVIHPKIPEVTSAREIKLQESCYAKVNARGRRMTDDYFCLNSPSMHKVKTRRRRGGYKKKRKTRKKKGSSRSNPQVFDPRNRRDRETLWRTHHINPRRLPRATVVPTSTLPLAQEVVVGKVRHTPRQYLKNLAKKCKGKVTGVCRTLKRMARRELSGSGRKRRKTRRKRRKKRRKTRKRRKR